jgi:hypothetical protein
MAFRGTWRMWVWDKAAEQYLSRHDLKQCRWCIACR